MRRISDASTCTTHTRTSPLRVHFVITSLPVGGAETLLVNLIRGLNRARLRPEVVCLKDPGELGADVAKEVPLHANLLRSKWDVRVLFRLVRLFRRRNTDAVITVGAGDKMFWGRLSARFAGVPVICSALHSTGWPDSVGRLNRLLTPITDGFIACAEAHAEFLSTKGGFPFDRVFTIPNGVDAERFKPNLSMQLGLRRELRIPEHSQVVGIVAALRPEKNHVQFVRAAREVLRKLPDTHFVVVGEGPERARIESEISHLSVQSHFHLLGQRLDTPEILAGLNVFCLSSRNEANPVSVLEALACGVPVVSPDVGSVSESVIHKTTGMLTKPLCVDSTADALIFLLANRIAAANMGAAGRQLVNQKFTLDAMVSGYRDLIVNLYNARAKRAERPTWQDPALDNRLQMTSCTASLPDSKPVIFPPLPGTNPEAASTGNAESN